MGESAIDHDLGPIIDPAAVKNYRAIKEVRVLIDIRPNQTALYDIN